MKKLIDRFDIGEVERKGVWFRYRNWSVLNVGELMKTAPFDWSEMFNGWEALNENGKIIREEKLENLLKHL